VEGAEDFKQCIVSSYQIS